MGESAGVGECMERVRASSVHTFIGVAELNCEIELSEPQGVRVRGFEDVVAVDAMPGEKLPLFAEFS